MATEETAAGAAHAPVRQLVAKKSWILMPMTVIFLASYIDLTALAGTTIFGLAADRGTMSSARPARAMT